MRHAVYEYPQEKKRPEKNIVVTKYLCQSGKITGDFFPLVPQFLKNEAVRSHRHIGREEVERRKERKVAEAEKMHLRIHDYKSPKDWKEKQKGRKPETAPKSLTLPLFPCPK